MSAETLDTVLFWATTGLIVFAILWLTLWLYKTTRAKSLNLTDMQKVKNDDVTPDFLKVNQEKRQAALDAAKVFDQYVAERDAPPADKAAHKCCLLAKTLTILLAIASLATGIIGALMRVEAYDAAVKKYGVWDNFVEVVSKYPVGFAVAVAVILIVGFNFYRSLRTG